MPSGNGLPLLNYTGTLLISLSNEKQQIGFSLVKTLPVLIISTLGPVSLFFMMQQCLLPSGSSSHYIALSHFCPSSLYYYPVELGVTMMRFHF